MILEKRKNKEGNIKLVIKRDKFFPELIMEFTIDDIAFAHTPKDIIIHKVIDMLEDLYKEK